MKGLFFFFVAALFTSCDYFKVQEKEDRASDIIAIVNTEKLFRKDLKYVSPKNISTKDSLILIKSFVQNWAIKKLLLSAAVNNNSSESLKNINQLVQDYKESLLINNYKEELIKQQLDTIVAEEEVEEFYLANNDNFKLNEVLVKSKYVGFIFKLFII